MKQKEKAIFSSTECPRMSDLFKKTKKPFYDYFSNLSSILDFPKH